MTPTEQHDWFMKSGRAMTNLGRLTANFDFPETFPFPSNRPVVMAANHRSLLDLVAAMGVFTRFGLSSRILVRNSYVQAGLGGRYLRSIGCIGTSTERKDEAEAEAVAALKAGYIVAMMPEGRLMSPEDWIDGVGPARPGISRIAVAADAVVVPVGFTNTELAWPKGKAPKVRIRRPQVLVRVGASIEMVSTDHHVNAEAVMNGIRAQLR